MAFRLKSYSAKKTVIRLEVYIKGEKSRFKYNTGRTIEPKYWSNKLNRCKSLKGDVGKRNREVNVILNEYETALQRIKDLYGGALTADKLKKSLDSYFKVNEVEVIKEVETVDNYFRLYYEELKGLGSVEHKSIKHYERVFNKFKEFENGKKVYLKDLKDNVYVGFIVFLRDNYGLNDNTLYRNFGYFKTFLNWCIKKGVEVPNDFKNIKLSPFDTDDISLTTQDIDTLAGLELEPRLERHRDLFLIGCYSGQRFSDYSVFEKADIQGDLIIKRAEKTETHSFIPLHPKLKALLDKYNWELGKISSQKFNKNIQKICKLAGFTEEIKNTSYIGSKKVVEIKQRWQMVASHTARRTFITIAAEKMMPDHIIMSITGIRDPKTLKKYKKVNKDSIMESAFNVFD
tara:strand:+ start:185 stop:1390 length:1206 start_codon:yes stop_codon:yes gene_type:complete